MGWEADYPHVAAALAYAEAVATGEVAACQPIVQACTRQLVDLEREWHFEFDAEAAERACRYIETLPHIKGRWAGTALRLEPWQSFGISTPFGWRYSEDVHSEEGEIIARAGTRRFRTAYTEVPRKNAKALALDTLVATADGFRQIREVHEGDLVYGASGTLVRVTAESQIFIGRHCYEVEFSTGERFVCDADHLWLTTARVDAPGRRTRKGMRHGDSRITRPRTTRELAATLTFGARGDRNHAVRLSAPIESSEQELAVEPYVLGAWLGDGHSTAARITNMDQEVLDEVARLEGELRLVAGSRGITYKIGARGALVSRLRSLGIFGAKRIPRQYFRASVTQRRELLRGLMDTDGTASKAGQCTYCSTSEQLVLDVAELIATLGLKPSIHSAEAKVYGRLVGRAWKVQFWPGFPVFKIARKAARQRSVAATSRSRTRTIVAVREVPSVPTKCLAVEGEMYLIGRTLVPTHNTTVAAGVGLYLLAADGEGGSEVYSAATTRKQASIVFSVAQEMARRATNLDVRAHNIHDLSTASKFEALHAQGETLDGYNIHGAICDELHAWKKRAVYEVIQTATGAREQPMIYSITTAGDNLEGICYELRAYLLRVLAGAVKDESFFGMIYTIDPKDDWRERSTWMKANPNWGVSVSPLELENDFLKAREVPSQLNVFLKYHLDVWTNSAVGWMDMMRFAALSDPTLRIEDFRGEPCWLGVDVSSKRDITALCALFTRVIDGRDHLFAFMRYWLPEEAIKSDPNGMYDGWVRMGAITATPGNVIDTDAIERATIDLGNEYHVRDVAIDPGHNSTQYGVHMLQAGFQVIDVRPLVTNFSDPMKWVEAYVLDGRFHYNCPVLPWMVSNVEARRDMKDNIYPRKASDRRKIDGIIALLMALNRLRASSAEESVSGLMVAM